MFRSRYPGTDVPSVSLTTYVLGESGDDDERPALVDATAGHKLTFGEVRAQSRRLAAGLATRIRKGDVVAIWAPNVPEYAVVFTRCSEPAQSSRRSTPPTSSGRPEGRPVHSILAT